MKLFFGVTRVDKIAMTAYALGYFGALPFVIFTFLEWQGYEVINSSLDLLYFYGVIILSFLGAPHWGYVLGKLNNFPIRKASLRLILGIIPSLVGFFSIFFDDLGRLLTIALGFLFAYIVDSVFFEEKGIPEWYLPLRMRLTFIVVSCFMISIFFKLQTAT